MSKANELLDSLNAEDYDYPVDDVAEEHIVISADRTITVPQALRRIAVQYDHNVETVTFDCPRYWDEHDMSKMAVYINYRTSRGTLGSYIAKNVTVDQVDPSVMHFEWTISKNVTLAVGKIAFLVCVKGAEEDAPHWNSDLCEDMYVSEGLESTVVDSEDDIDPDILTQILLLNTITLERASVYVGSGEMPEWANVKIDPNGDDIFDWEGPTTNISIVSKVVDGVLRVSAGENTELPVWDGGAY